MKDLSRHLKIKGKEEYDDLRSLIDDLDRKGIINSDERGRVQYVVQKEGPTAPSGKKLASNKIVGTLSAHRRGFGFVKVEGAEEDVSARS